MAAPIRTLARLANRYSLGSIVLGSTIVVASRCRLAKCSRKCPPGTGRSPRNTLRRSFDN